METKRPTRQDATAWTLIEELRSYAADSVNCGVPEPILAGHPIHHKMDAYQKSFPPPHRTPAKCRILWKRLLQLSRSNDSHAFDAADELLEWLEQEHPLDGEDGPPPDGPDRLVPRFWYEGTGHPLSSKQWAVLVRAWPMKEIPVDDVCEAVWENGLPSNNALKQLLKRINARLQQIGAPHRVCQENGLIRILA
jgi:hypothetical protein